MSYRAAVVAVTILLSIFLIVVVYVGLTSMSVYGTAGPLGFAVDISDLIKTYVVLLCILIAIIAIAIALATPLGM